MELALLGNWTGIDVAERGMLAQALWAAAGGKGVPTTVAPLCDPGRLRQAASWGQAIRLAHRFGGGATRVLDRAGLRRLNGLLTLRVDAGAAALYGEVVRKHHLALAETLGLRAVLAEV
jgi:hypothetical protein